MVRHAFLFSLVLIALAETAHADPLGTWTWTWVHVAPGTTTQITPQIPGVVSPGEAVEFRGTFEFTGIGTIQTSQNTGFSGPIVGIATRFFSFIAGANQGGHFYEPVTINPLIPVDPLIRPDRVDSIAVGQLAVAGVPLQNTQSILVDAVKIRWNPVSYHNRIVEFHPEPEPTWPSPTGTNLVLLVDSVNLYYDSYQLPMASWGSLQVPIVPSPSAALLLAVSGILLGGRRRHRPQAARSTTSS